MPLPPLPDPTASPDDDGSHRHRREHRPHRRQRHRTPGPVPVPARRGRRPPRPPVPSPSPAPSPPTPHDESRDWDISDLVAAGVLDVVPGDPPVPVSVWRATGPNDPPVTTGSILTGLTTRPAEMLLAIWSDPGDLVIDTTADPAVQRAAAAWARTYRAVVPALSRGQMPAPDERAALILLRWPPACPPDHPGHTRPAHGPAATAGHLLPATVTAEDPGSPDPGPVLRACRDLLAPDGHTVVILAPPAGGHYRDHARVVIPAARNAGLGYLQHLVVITTDAQANRPGTDGVLQARAHADLLVLVIRAAASTDSPPRSLVHHRSVRTSH